MFTGIVLGAAPIVRIEQRQEARTHVVAFANEWLAGLTPGASVAHNGCCLTVTAIDGNEVSFDLIGETLAKTNLGCLKEGDRVNIERAARFGDEIGGHVMSGHIMTTVAIQKIVRTPDNCAIWFTTPPAQHEFLLPKGFVGLNGCSLTLGEVTPEHFAVHLIPETLSRTLFGQSQVGERVNLEIDSATQAIVETVKRYLKPSEAA